MAKKKTTADKRAKREDRQAVRPPIVVILGHIDHGKTTLLDYIRKTRVAAKEAGGITQSIGAYQVELATGDKRQATREITFIDTPGHEAFSKMRERGASVADIAVLVVAANDGMKPQTVEAIAHAKAAGIPLVVAINKIDLASTKEVTKIKGQLAKEGVIAEDQGGDTPLIVLSAKTGQGVPELLEMIGLVADLLEIKAEPKASLEVVVIESLLSSQQGPLATVVVKKGSLKVGDRIFAAGIGGRVKALVDDRGKRIRQIGPGVPSQVLGFSDVVPVGAKVTREPKDLEAEPKTPVPEQPSSQATDLNVILRTDTQGSLEAVSAALGKLKVEDKGVKILLKGVGAVGDSDIRLASITQGIVLGFNVPVASSTMKLADDLGVGVRPFEVIYDLLETVEKLLHGAKAIEEEEKPPEAEVLKIFTLHSGDVVAGSRVLNGKIKYRDKVKVLREGEEVHRGRVRGLKIGKETASGVRVDQEVGILIKPRFDVRKGDRIVVSSN